MKYERAPEKAPHKNENFSLVLLSNKKNGIRAIYAKIGNPFRFK